MYGSNVKLMGVAGDGITDDTGALQAAFDIASNSGTLLLGNPGDVYKTTAPLKARSNLKFDLRGATVWGNFNAGAVGVIGQHGYRIEDTLNSVSIMNGTLRKLDNTQPGRLLSLVCDDLRLHNITGHVGANGFAFVGGERMDITDCVALGARKAAGAPGIRVVAGSGRIMRCHMEAGDDAYSFATGGVANAMASGMQNRDIHDFIVYDCTGVSHKARLIAIGQLDHDSVPGGMTCSTRSVHFNGVKGVSHSRGIVVYNLDSTGPMQNFNFRNVDVSINIDLFAPPIRIVGQTGLIDNVQLNDVVIRNPFSPVIEAVGKVTNVYDGVTYLFR